MNDATASPLPEPGLPPPLGVDFLYRVFCVKEEMPKIEKLLKRLTGDNPHNPPNGWVFPPPGGMRRLQNALGASQDFFVMGYTREEAPKLWEDLEAALPEQKSAYFDEPDRLCVRDAKLCVVIRAQIKNPESNEYVETLVHLADAFRDLLNGIVWDVQMGRVWGHDAWCEGVMPDPLSVLAHVNVRVLPRPDGAKGRRVRTLGLRKFGNPDLLVDSVPEDVTDLVGNMLRDFSEHISQGDLLGADEVIDYNGAKVRTVAATPLHEGDNEIVALADEVEGQPELDAKAGMPKMISVLRAQLEDKEGKRAGGGKGAQ